MSWYVGLDGRQMWVERENNVFTVGDAPEEEELSLHNLAYLATTSAKSVFAEHMIDEDAGGSKTKKAKERTAGRQRGFVVRLADDGRTRVTADLQAAVDHLVGAGSVTRVDIDDSISKPSKKKKNKDKAGEEEEVDPDQPPMLPLGPNECRVETTGRIQHFAHGRGFRVDVFEPGTRQRIHMYTPDKEVPVAEWHRLVVAAIKDTGGQAMLGRMVGGDEGGSNGKAAQPAPPPRVRDQAKQDEDDWLDSVMGMAKAPKPAASAAAVSGAGEAAAGPDGCTAGEEAAPEKPKKQLPPWLRMRR